MVRCHAGSCRASRDQLTCRGAALRYGCFIPKYHSGYGIDDLVLLSPCVSGVKATPICALVSLPRNHPDPFESQTAMTYDLASRGHITLEILDVARRCVCILADEVQGVGPHLEI
jgi:hypothetical protein